MKQDFNPKNGKNAPNFESCTCSKTNVRPGYHCTHGPLGEGMKAIKRISAANPMWKKEICGFSVKTPRAPFEPFLPIWT
jgi:hypothetical protein